MANIRFKGSDTLVLGAGVTGVATVRYLLSQGLQPVVADNRSQPPGRAPLVELLPAEKLHFGISLERIELVGFKRIFVSPGLPSNLALFDQARARGIELVSDIALFLRRIDRPLIAVTGTNGKSTVVTMIAHLLRRAGKQVLAGGNLGPAALDLLQQPVPDYYLLELSSFQLEWIDWLGADVAVITNIAPDHLDRYDSFASYGETKAKLLRGARHVVLSLEDPQLRKMAMKLPADVSVHWFGEGRDSDRGLTTAAPLQVVPGLAGRHNQLNGQAALEVLRALGEISQLPDSWAEIWSGFRSLDHRMVLVGQWRGVDWFDDSKATNVAATLAAVEGISLAEDGKIVLILGGDGKQQDFSPLQRLLPRLRAVVVTGRDGEQLAQQFVGKVAVSQGVDMDEVVLQALELVQPGDCVLLSPACASTDQYSGYQQRGELFGQAVRRIGEPQNDGC